MSASHIVLGSNSLLGAALVTELLERGGEVCCVVPAGDGDGGGDPSTAPEWLGEAVRRLAADGSAQASEQQVASLLERCQTIGQASEQALEVSAVEEVGHVWDARQLGRFQDEPQAVLADTRAGLELTARCSSKARYHLFSATDAYGDHDGLISASATQSEGAVETGAAATTEERRGRIEAERAVLHAGPARARVLRTGMTLGPMAELALQPSGLYALLQLLRRLRENIDEAIGHILARRPLSILSSETAPVELISCTAAARAAVASADEQAPIAHLVAANALSLGEVLEVIAEIVGVRAIHCVDDPALMNSIDHTLDGDVRTRQFKRRGRHRFERTPLPGVVEGGFDVSIETLRGHLAGRR